MLKCIAAFAALSSCVVLFSATNATASPVPCASHTVVSERLTGVYGERRKAIGLAGEDAVLEIYASEESGSWSITITKVGGPTCLVAAGKGFRLEAPVVVEDPDA